MNAMVAMYYGWYGILAVFAEATVYGMLWLLTWLAQLKPRHVFGLFILTLLAATMHPLLVVAGLLVLAYLYAKHWFPWPWGVAPDPPAKPTAKVAPKEDLYYDDDTQLWLERGREDENPAWLALMTTRFIRFLTHELLRHDPDFNKRSYPWGKVGPTGIPHMTLAMLHDYLDDHKDLVKKEPAKQVPPTMNANPFVSGRGEHGPHTLEDKMSSFPMDDAAWLREMANAPGDVMVRARDLMRVIRAIEKIQAETRAMADLVTPQGPRPEDPSPLMKPRGKRHPSPPNLSDSVSLAMFREYGYLDPMGGCGDMGYRVAPLYGVKANHAILNGMRLTLDDEPVACPALESIPTVDIRKLPWKHVRLITDADPRPSPPDKDMIVLLVDKYGIVKKTFVSK